MACAPAPTSAPIGSPPGSETPSNGPPSPAASPASSPTVESVRLYLVLGFGSQRGLVPVERGVEAGSATPERAVELLLQGPSDGEAAARPAIYTAIPEGVELRSLTIEDGVARVDLGGAFETPMDDGLATSMRLAQVVYTLTRFPGVESVRFLIDGELVMLIGPDGLEFSADRPLHRDDLVKALSPLFVDDPAWGSEIRSPVRIAGLANAFEATFQVRIADAEGRGLAAGPVMATCGTGCWGEFDELVPFTVQAAGPGVLQAFELSPKDGGMDNLREYPVWLLP